MEVDTERVFLRIVLRLVRKIFSVQNIEVGELDKNCIERVDVTRSLKVEKRQVDNDLQPFNHPPYLL